MFLNPDELMIIYNALERKGHGDIAVSFPYLDMELFTYNLEEDHLRNFVQGHRFSSARDDAVSGASPFIAFDTPKFGDLKDALLSSGLLRYHNWDRFRAQMRTLSEQSEDPSLYPQSLVVGIDTNVAYNRLFTRSFPLKFDGASPIGAGDFHFTVSELVLKELDRQIDRKYHPETTREMERIFHRGELARDFSNGSPRANRKAKSALMETSYLLREMGATVAGKGTPLPKEKEDADRAIAASYREYGDETGTRAALITCDQDMTYHARNAGISSLLLEIPHYIPNSLRSDPWRFCSLMFDLSVNFGVVELAGECSLLSEWRGKNTRDHDAGNLKAVFADRQLHDDVRDWLFASRSVMG